MKYRIIEAYVGEPPHFDAVCDTLDPVKTFDPRFVTTLTAIAPSTLWEAGDSKGRLVQQAFLRSDSTLFHDPDAFMIVKALNEFVVVRETSLGKVSLYPHQVEKLLTLIDRVAFSFDDTCADNLKEIQKLFPGHHVGLLGVKEQKCVKPVENTKVLTVEVPPGIIILGTKRLLDSVWTIRGYFTVEGKVFITSYNREDEEGYARERELPTAHLIESEEPEKRTVTGISIADRHCPFMADEERAEWKQYAVANPGFVFGYGA